MTESTLQTLRSLGQSVWLDDLRRDYLDDGTLKKLIRDDGLAGITSNPAIFERAMDQSDAYDADIERFARAGDNAATIYEKLAVADIQCAADLLRPLYDQTHAAHGYVSLEVSPHLAADTAATVEEAKRLWFEVERPNIMIKVPGTEAGLPAIRALIAAGLNINITLLFSPVRYGAVIDAYWSGLEDRLARNESVAHIASVASFFLSRIDVWVDRVLNQSACMTMTARGTAATTAAALAYQRFRASLDEPRWQKLRAAGANIQRVLWASTGTKDPSYSDVKYIEALIAPDTVTTMPMPTLQAYRDHGRPEVRINDVVDKAQHMQQTLQILDIDLEAVARELEREGIRKFVEPFDKLMRHIEQKRQHAVAST